MSQTRRARWVAPLLVAGYFAVAGPAVAYLWSLWRLPEGIAYGGTYYPSAPGSSEFAVTGHYVLVALAAGLLGGVLTVWLGRDRPMLLLTIAAAGSILAGWGSAMLGRTLGPGDPDALARTAADGTRISSDLSLASWVCILALPAGVLLVTTLAFVLMELRGPMRVRPREVGTVRP